MIRARGSVQSLASGGGEADSSHLLLRIAVDGLAILTALVAVRLLFLSISVRPTLWVGRAIYGVTDPLAYPFTLLPGGNHELFGLVTVADLTLMAIMVLIPVAAIAWGRHRQS